MRGSNGRRTEQICGFFICSARLKVTLLRFNIDHLFISVVETEDLNVLFEFA